MNPTAPSVAGELVQHGAGWLDYGALGLLGLFMVLVIVGAGWIAKRLADSHERAMTDLAESVRAIAGGITAGEVKAIERHGEIRTAIGDIRTDLARIPIRGAP